MCGALCPRGLEDVFGRRLAGESWGAERPVSEDASDLVTKCARGDAAAWERLVREYSGLVFAVARAAGLPHDACEDVAQATFAALSRTIANVRDAKALPAWLTVTARREAIRVRRQAARRRYVADHAIASDLAAPTDDVDVSRLEAHQRLRVAMEELDPRCRDLLRALYFQATPSSYQRISENLGIPLGSIGPTRVRCLAKLSALLGLNGE